MNFDSLTPRDLVWIKEAFRTYSRFENRSYWNNIVKSVGGLENVLPAKDWLEKNDPEFYRSIRWNVISGTASRAIDAARKKAAISHIKSGGSENEKSLMQQLREQTLEFKKEFIEKRVLWELDRQVFLIKRYGNFRYEDWVGMFPRGNMGLTQDGQRLRDEVDTYKRIPPQKLKEKAEKEAVEYFDTALAQLVNRLNKKGFTNPEVHVKTVNVSLEATIRQADMKTVYARTIIASGPIQRPHYRFIIT